MGHLQCVPAVGIHTHIHPVGVCSCNWCEHVFNRCVHVFNRCVHVIGVCMCVVV